MSEQSTKRVRPKKPEGYYSKTAKAERNAKYVATSCQFVDQRKKFLAYCNNDSIEKAKQELAELRAKEHQKDFSRASNELQAATRAISSNSTGTVPLSQVMKKPSKVSAGKPPAPPEKINSNGQYIDKLFEQQMQLGRDVQLLKAEEQNKYLNQVMAESLRGDQLRIHQLALANAPKGFGKQYRKELKKQVNKFHNQLLLFANVRTDLYRDQEQQAQFNPNYW